MVHEVGVGTVAMQVVVVDHWAEAKVAAALVAVTAVVAEMAEEARAGAGLEEAKAAVT